MSDNREHRMVRLTPEAHELLTQVRERMQQIQYDKAMQFNLVLPKSKLSMSDAVGIACRSWADQQNEMPPGDTQFGVECYDR